MGVHAIHHVTAVTAQIAENLRFYTGTLGLRLVKKSVNQDDVSAYHLFYADAVGSPGTDMTFFDWPTIGPNRPGAASIARTSFRVPPGSLEFWQERVVGGPLEEDDQGRRSMSFTDPEGQRLELVEDGELPRDSSPWTREVPEAQAIRGILGVDLHSARPSSTEGVLREVLGYERKDGFFVTEDDGTYARIRLIGDPAPIGRLGAGGVHHVAFRVADDDELFRLQERVERLGINTSGYVNRFYFHSLYFREPGGILFELATDGPGFASDEDMATLGEKLALPPFLEPHRERIEAGLKPI
jgi:glyoxalase family protein